MLEFSNCKFFREVAKSFDILSNEICCLVVYHDGVYFLGPNEREVQARGMGVADVDKDSYSDDDAPDVKIPLPMNLPQVNLDVTSLQLDEDWDVEIKEDEKYQETINTHTKRKDANSALIDAFQNSINRYPPCMHAFSQTACYESLVYKKCNKSESKGVVFGSQEDGQFDDVEE